LRAGADGTPPPLCLGLSPSSLARELLRALYAFGLYLLLYPLWFGCGAGAAYESFVLRTATALHAVTQHFPYRSAIQHLQVRPYFESLFILVLGYAVVSYGMGWGARTRRLVLLVVAIFIVHAVALTVQTKVRLARELWASERVMLLLPRELQAAVWFKYMLFEFGFQFAPFVLIGLWVYWNANERAKRPAVGTASRNIETILPEKGLSSRVTRSLRRGIVCVAAVLLTVSGLYIWSSLRERDPRHIQTHVWFGDRFLLDRQWTLAEGQYRAAIEGGSQDGRVFYNLAELRWRQGDLAGSLAILRRGLEIVRLTAWRDRAREAAKRWGSVTSPP